MPDLAEIGRDIVALCLGAKNVVGFLESRELAHAQARLVEIICRNKKLTPDPVRFAIEVAGLAPHRLWQ